VPQEVVAAWQRTSLAVAGRGSRKRRTGGGIQEVERSNGPQPDTWNEGGNATLRLVTSTAVANGADANKE